MQAEEEKLWHERWRSIGTGLAVVLSLVALVLTYSNNSTNQRTLYRPYLAIDPAARIVVQARSPRDSQPADVTDWFELRIPLVNVGTVPIKYQVQDFLFDGKGSYPTTSVGVLMPKQQHFALQRFVIPPTDAFKGIPGKGSLRVNYWSPGDPSRTHFASITFRIGPDQALMLDDQDAD